MMENVPLLCHSVDVSLGAALLTGRMHGVPRAESLLDTRGSSDKTDRATQHNTGLKSIQFVPEQGKYWETQNDVSFSGER